MINAPLIASASFNGVTPLLAYLLCLSAGFLSKLTDLQVDDKLYLQKNLQFATGALYGAIAGYLASLSTPFATVILAVAIGVLLTGKIDKRAHQLAIASLFLTLAFLGLPAVNLIALVFLLLLGVADEFLNDYLEGRSVPLFAFIARRRLLLDFGALALSIATNEWAYFLAVASFDFAYQFTGFLRPQRALPGAVGHHLLLDLYDCDVRRLEDARLIKRILRALPTRVGMKRISEPTVKKYSSKTDEGLTGFVLLAESHCSVHAYPRFATAHCDVFSCKPFNARVIVDYLKKAFKAKNSIERMVVRSEN